MKKQKIFFLFIILISIFNFCGCNIKTDGNTLHGFTQRMNELNPDYNMTEAGYIYDEAATTLTKYYVVNNCNIMLRFEMESTNELSSLHIVFDNLTQSNTQELDFIKNCIECYCNNEETCNNLLAEINFPRVLFTKDINTLKKENGNTEIIIDVTEIGSVISVVQNTP